MPLHRLVSALAPPVCVACGGHAGGPHLLCGACRSSLRWLSPEPQALAGILVWAPLAYHGPSRAIVGALKYGRLVTVADAMAAQMLANAPLHLLAERTLVPVPLHPARRRKRGFNQAERLARALSARAGLEWADCLARSGSRRTQVGRARAQRLRSVEGTIALRDGVRRPSRCLLVDDVITTGATLAACARELRAVGAEVAAIAYARTPGR